MVKKIAEPSESLNARQLYDEEYAHAQREKVQCDNQSGLRDSLRAAIAVHKENLDVAAAEYPLEELQRAGKRAAAKNRNRSVKAQIGEIIAHKSELLSAQLNERMSDEEKQRAVEAARKAEKARAGRGRGHANQLASVNAKRKDQAQKQRAQVLRLTREGVGVGEIAKKIGRSRSTVERHLATKQSR